MHDELQDIFSGIGQNAGTNLIQSALGFLRASKRAGGEVEKTEFLSKKAEKRCLTDFSAERKCLLSAPEEGLYIAEGAEQKVYLDTSGRYVIKLNDTVFYASWEDYLIALLVHNSLLQLMNFWVFV